MKKTAFTAIAALAAAAALAGALFFAGCESTLELPTTTTSSTSTTSTTSSSTSTSSSSTLTSTTTSTTSTTYGGTTQGDYYVSTTGLDTNSGTSIGAPFRTITKALSVVQAGETVLIRGGEYNESPNFNVSGTNGNWITFEVYGTETATIDGTSVGTWGPGIASGVQYLHLKGLHITDFGQNGLTCWGTNQYLKFTELMIYNCGSMGASGFALTEAGGSGLVTDVELNGCTIRNNFIGMKAMDNTIRRLVIRDTTFAYNTGDPASDGIGFEGDNNYITLEGCVSEYNAGDGFDFKGDYITIRRSISRHNERDGIKLWGTNSILENCLSHHNGLLGVVVDHDASVEAYNNTVAYNATAGTNYAMFVAYISDPGGPSSIVLRNNIFVHTDGTILHLGSIETIVEDHNLYYTAASGSNAIDAAYLGQAFTEGQITNGTWTAQSGQGSGSKAGNPLFVNTSNDFHLQSGSPARDTGSSASAPVVDLEGTTRPINVIDMGCYEQ